MSDNKNDDNARTRNKRQQTRDATWNVTSFTYKHREIVLKIKEHHVDLCSISVIKEKGKGNMKMNDHIFIYSRKEKNTRACPESAYWHIKDNVQ